MAGVDSLQTKIDYFISQAQFDSARLFIESNLNADSESSNELNYELVKVLFIQSDYEQALKKAFFGLDNVTEQAEEVKYNFMIGCIYSAISDYNKSIEYLSSAVEESMDSSLSVQAHLISSDLHLQLGDSASALTSLSAAYAITSNSGLDDKLKSHVAIQYNFLSGNYEVCKEMNLEIIADTNSYLSAKSYALSILGDCLVKQDSLQKAAEYYDQFLKLTFSTKDPEQVKVAAEKLIDVYELLGEQDKANAYHKIYNEAEGDSMSFSIEKYRNLYDVEKEREIGIAQRKLINKYLMVGGLVLLFIVGIIIFYLNKQKVEKERIAANKIVISDEEIGKIKSAVNNLISKQLYLTPGITRKSFCKENEIKSERYLSHFVNENYKKSFSIFLNDLRVEYAYDRIHKDEVFRHYKIEEIAKACGFGSKKSFERAFVAKYDITPFKLILNI